ncbi:MULTISPECIES: hypothetical protein [Brevibacterium]|uniref:hypothetical protein n=1 Tax=Brevibacterium TaxID=1696 RepID=UPI0007823D9F|nr:MULTISPECIES: hypothetical protein [Brevibacterium]TGD12965.1 hypothetical protein EB836_03280 [Brevibacterium sp. S111]
METKRRQILRVGFFADGVFKAIVALAMLVLYEPLTENQGVPGWLFLLTVVAVVSSAVAEIAYAVRNGAGRLTKHLLAYDAGWILVTIGALLLALRFGVPGWTLWFGYQLVASPIVAMVFFRGARFASHPA